MEGNGKWLLCNWLSHNTSFFWISQWKRNFPGEAHMRNQGGWKTCIGTEEERFSGGASEGRSNRAEYPVTNVQLGSGSAGMRAKGEGWFGRKLLQLGIFNKKRVLNKLGVVDGGLTWRTICISKRLLEKNRMFKPCVYGGMKASYILSMTLCVSVKEDQSGVSA